MQGVDFLLFFVCLEIFSGNRDFFTKNGIKEKYSPLPEVNDTDDLFSLSENV